MIHSYIRGAVDGAKGNELLLEAAAFLSFGASIPNAICYTYNIVRFLLQSEINITNHVELQFNLKLWQHKNKTKVILIRSELYTLAGVKNVQLQSRLSHIRTLKRYFR